MNKYCENFTGGKCERLTKIFGKPYSVPKSFCENVCRGKYNGGDMKVLPPAITKKQEFYKDTSIITQAGHFASAMKRFAKDGFKTVDEKTFSERAICCLTCTDKGRCPYCGCCLKYKSRLNSEISCPNPKTYPKLSYYPPKDYWAVCNETTTAIIPARNEPAERLNKTIQGLKDNAAGKLEIIVILDGYICEVPDDIRVIRTLEPQGKRAAVNKAAQIARGDYVFIVDAHCAMNEGWDTRLKCACDNNTIAVSMIKPMDEEFEPKKEALYGFTLMTDDFEAKWCKPEKYSDSSKLISEVMSFTGCGFMIRKDDFIRLGGYDESLGRWGHEGEEWSFKIYCAGGKIALRKDVVCGHIFGTNAQGRLYIEPPIPRAIFKSKMLEKYGDKIAEYFDKWQPSQK